VTEKTLAALAAHSSLPLLEIGGEWDKKKGSASYIMKLRKAMKAMPRRQKDSTVAPKLRVLDLTDQSVNADFISVLKKARRNLRFCDGYSVGEGAAAQHVHYMMGGGPTSHWY
jgi:hypothetical protein